MGPCLVFYWLAIRAIYGREVGTCCRNSLLCWGFGEIRCLPDDSDASHHALTDDKLVPMISDHVQCSVFSVQCSVLCLASTLAMLILCSGFCIRALSSCLFRAHPYPEVAPLFCLPSVAAKYLVARLLEYTIQNISNNCYKT
ncbi:hypothetical protein V1520DRAFT_332543 [Lipomyces starkeyi]